MTTPEQMTDEALRVEIAEWCGWAPDADVYWSPPNCLNAIHEAVERLRGTESHEVRYHKELESVVQGVGGTMDFDLVNATARQRAIALVRTIREGV
jgi:hypothetical protein